jgi:hypothetical protein
MDTGVGAVTRPGLEDPRDQVRFATREDTFHRGVQIAMGSTNPSSYPVHSMEVKRRIVKPPTHRPIMSMLGVPELYPHSPIRLHGA